MRIPLPSARRRARIEIIPLIDIIFFLLATFVMVSLSMVRNRGISVSLPSASAAARQERTSTVAQVTVTESGDIYLDRQKMGLKELSARLSQRKEKESDLRVFIYGDERAQFGKVIRVLDEVKSLGIPKAFIQTKPFASSEDAAR